MIIEQHKRSIVKSIIWRLVGVILLASVTYFYTHNWITTSWVTFLHHGIFLFVFYIHERLWLKCKKPISLLRLSIYKMFTYETCCGNIILGTITYFITGNIMQSGKITITYIFLKHIIFIWNEFIWENIKWGK